MTYDDNGTEIGSKRKGNVPNFRASKRGRVSEYSSVNSDDNTGLEDTDFDSSSDQSYSRRGSMDDTVFYNPIFPLSLHPKSTLSTHHINSLYQYTLLTHTIITHPFNTFYQITLSMQDNEIGAPSATSTHRASNKPTYAISGS